MQNNLSQQVERLTIGESSEYLGVSIDTLRRWEKKGVIAAVRSPGGHRYFLKKDLDLLFGHKYTRTLPQVIKKTEVEKPKTIAVPTPIKETIVTNILTPPSQTTQQPQEAKPQEQISQTKSHPKKEISWTTIIIIGLVLFTVVDIILLIVFLTSSQPLAKPVP